MKEIYKDIADYEGKYQISNYGNVKSKHLGYFINEIEASNKYKSILKTI